MKNELMLYIVWRLAVLFFIAGVVALHAEAHIGEILPVCKRGVCYSADGIRYLDVSQ